MQPRQQAPGNALRIKHSNPNAPLSVVYPLRYELQQLRHPIAKFYQSQKDPRNFILYSPK